MGGYFDREKGEFHIGVHPQGIQWNSNEEKIIHAKQDAWDYKGDVECHMQYITDITFHEDGIRQQTVAWVLSQNIEVTLNGVNSRHYIQRKQIV
jgi:hypothetical protein